MNFRQIRYFLSLADEVHVFNISKKKNSIPLSLQRQIKILERKLEVKLFEPYKQELLLTPAGVFLKNKWSPILNHLDAIHTFAKDIESGETDAVRVAHMDCIDPRFVQNLFVTGQKSAPRWNVSTEVSAYGHPFGSLLEYKSDFAITRDIPPVAHISSFPLFGEPLCLVVPDDHPFHVEEDIKPDSMQHQKILLPVSEPGGLYSAMVKDILTTYHMPEPMFLGSSFSSSLPDFIRKGLGISIQPSTFVFGRDTGLRFIPLPFETQVSLCWRTEDERSLIQRVLYWMEND